MSSAVERGVAVVVADENAVTIAVTEKVLTVSMAVAMICSSDPTAFWPRSIENENGSSGPRNRAASATSTAITVKIAVRTHTCRPRRRKKDATDPRAAFAMGSTLVRGWLVPPGLDARSVTPSVDSDDREGCPSGRWTWS
ncbi:MAG: hypothetical protein K0R81_2710 [Microbacterium sp.]|nr:hypothetical protein [Microbacterium sp.]